MVRKKVSTWLIGAAMTIATPGRDVQNETIASPGESISTPELYEQKMSFDGNENQKFWLSGEPTISDLLSDPITRLLMKRDGVSAHSLVVLIESVREKLLTSSMNDRDTSI